MNNGPIKIALKRISEGIFCPPYDKEWAMNVLSTQLAEADLSGVLLHDVNLRFEVLRCETDFHKIKLEKAIIRNCNFDYSIFTGANFESCKVEDTFFYRCDLSSVNFANAIFKNVKFLECDLRGSDFSGVALTDVVFAFSNLSGTKFDYTEDTVRNPNFFNVSLKGSTIDDDSNLHKIYPLCCPPEGAFIGWKKAKDGVIVKLAIPADARRSSATGRKCRCNKAKVVDIFESTSADCGKHRTLPTAVSEYDNKFLYKLGEMVEVPNFYENRWTECASGIHFFMTLDEALNYSLY